MTSRRQRVEVLLPTLSFSLNPQACVNMVQELASGRFDTGKSPGETPSIGHITAGVALACASAMLAKQGVLHQDAQDPASQGSGPDEAVTGSRVGAQDPRPGSEPAASAEHACHVVPVIEWWKEGQDGSILVQQGTAQCSSAPDWMDYYQGESKARCLAQMAASAGRSSTAPEVAAAVAQVQPWAAGFDGHAGVSGRGSQQQQQQMRQHKDPGRPRSMQRFGGSIKNGSAGAVGKESIRQARLRQDQERRVAEEAALLSYRFRANPVPSACSQPRWAMAPYCLLCMPILCCPCHAQQVPLYNITCWRYQTCI